MGGVPAPRVGEEKPSVAKPETTPGKPAPESKPAPAPPQAADELKVKIPPILLEGDQPAARPVPSEPRVAARPAAAPLPEVEEELPDAYGTGRLFLVARDPRCLYAHWDFTAEQLRYHNGRAADRHLVVRVFRERHGGERVAEVHVHPESRHWFIHVDWPGTPYVAELGYYTTAGEWHSLAVSITIFTPAEGPTAEAEVARFATFESRREGPKPAVPVIHAVERPATEKPVSKEATLVSIQHVPWQKIVTEPGTAAPPHISTGPRQPMAAGVVHGNGALAGGADETTWTVAQEEALWELMGVSLLRREWPGSAEIAELAMRKRERERGISSAEVAQAAAPAGLPGVTISSPAAVPQEAVSSPVAPEAVPGKRFWFNVNAELVIYGTTEPDARVTIGDRTIRLRPDGTFSYRFALPDGNYALPIVATATHGERRSAELRFYRGTQYDGEVGKHPQDPALRTPSPENV